MTTKTPNGLKLAHDDHGLQPEHLAVIDTAMENESGFVIKLVELPEGCPDLQSALYGPEAGDPPVTEAEVIYEKRNGRPGPSRLIDKPERPCRRMVIIGIANDVLFTAYGTQANKPSPMEWWDAKQKPHEAIESAKFWSEHALAINNG
jgi:hypothetical protein